MNSLAKKIVLSLSAVVIAYAGIGYALGKSNEDKTYRSLTVFNEVLDHVAHDYVDTPDLRQVSIGAMHGLLDSLDPQSSYLSPLEYADYKKKAEEKGRDEIGAALSKRFGYVVVISVLPDSPAQKAGIRGGDILESIAGFTSHDMSIGQAATLLSGEPGSSVTVSVIRRGHSEPIEIDVIHAKMQPPRLVEDKMAGDIAYLRVPAFEPGATIQIREKLSQIERQGAHKLILDLRDSAIGKIQEGVSTAQLFLNSGTIVTLHGQTVAAQTFSADPSKVVWHGPLTVLISSGTAGPAEVLAAAIAENHRGETVGDRTFGTASEQKLIPLDDGAALILTVANYFTPTGKSIPADGVAPTVEVRLSPDDLNAMADRDQTGLRPPSPDDPVVKKAIEILQNTTPQRHAA
jgi:carboxyl-terminal processing protease